MGFSKMMELLQQKNKGKIVFCNTGNFYIAIGKDAVLLNNLIDLKLSCLKQEEYIMWLYEKLKSRTYKHWI